jgi:murein DD-endopeptidase MepM/ murein hydrolase activator NlpD
VKTLLNFKQRRRPDNKKRDWNAAIQRYNLPANGIEVRIPGDYKPKATFASKTTSPPASRHSSTKPLRYIATRSLFIACGLATLGNIPVYSMVSPTASYSPVSGSADHASTQVLKDLSLPDAAVETYSGYSVDLLPDVAEGNWKSHLVDEKDTLQNALEDMGVGNMIKALQSNPAIAKELDHLKNNTHLFAQVVDGQLQQLIYAQNKTHAYIVSYGDEGFTGKWDDSMFEARNSRVAFTIKHSIQKDGKAAGLTNPLIRQLSLAFSKDFNLQKSIKLGDKIGLIYEDYRYQGESIATDKVLAAEYSNNSKTLQRIRFTLADGKTGYFSPDSDTEMKRTAFDRVPVAGARMSSGFGFRKHPVFGFTKAHTGVDYAAARGTPIHATADGNVKFIGRQHGYGNVIELRHGSGVSTLYGHMSGFKSGLGQGESVKRGDVIGYVGSTGTSTGNHVHYEYRINGAPQNPVSVSLPQTGVMTASEARSFKTLAADMGEQLANLRKVAALDKPIEQQNGG